MTKKHFIALADALRFVKVPPPVLEALVEFCHTQSRHFNEARWRGYLAGKCGPNGGKLKKTA